MEELDAKSSDESGRPLTCAQIGVHGVQYVLSIAAIEQQDGCRIFGRQLVCETDSRSVAKRIKEGFLWQKDDMCHCLCGSEATWREKLFNVQRFLRTAT